MVAPPNEVPEIFKPAIEKLSRQSRQILNLKVVPYYIQAKLGDSGYVTVEDLADRWNKADDAREKGPRELKFEPNSNDYTQEFSELCAMRLFQAVKHAKLSGGNTVALGADAPLSMSSKFALDIACDRAQLEVQYQMKTNCPRPPLEDQGSDSFLKKQYRFCMKGEIGFFTSKQIVSLLPDLEERPVKRRRTLVQALEGEDDEETRSNPTTMRQLERMQKVFMTNLLMCIYAFPQFSQLEVSKKELEDFYNWLNGPSIGARTPQPSVYTIMMAERNAWREIARKMHLGQTLSTALADMRSDLLFWQREVYEKLEPKGKGKGPQQQFRQPIKGGGKSYPPRFQSQKGKPFKGQKGRKGKKGDGKGKKGGKMPGNPNWAKENPKGVPYCMNFHLKGQCQGNCGRSHNCPVMKDGWVCNAPPEQHSPQNCPYL